MKSLTRLTVPALAALAFAVSSSDVSAQAAAAAPAARRGGAPAVAPLTPAQQVALNSAQPIPAALTDAVTAANTELRRAAFTAPQVAGEIAAKVKALADAELALALTRANSLASVQEALKPLTSEQAVAFGARAGGGGGGRGGNLPADTADGFVPLFDGKTLAGWDGDPMFWSVKDGVIHAESTPDKVVGSVYPGNTFLIWRGKVRDFELKVDYRFVGPGNSGVQIRSRLADPATRPWGISGYQMDMVTAGGTGSGVFYTEGGGFGLLPQGTAVRAVQGERRLIGSLGPGIADIIKPGPEWNNYHIVAYNNQISAFINGRLSAMLIDEDRAGAQYAQDGLLALQMHAGQPFSVEFKNVYLKDLKPENLTPTPAPPGQGRGGRGGAPAAPASAPAGQ